MQKSPAPWSARIRPSPTTSAIEGIASDVDLLCDLDGIVDFDAEVADGVYRRERAPRADRWKEVLLSEIQRQIKRQRHAAPGGR